MKPRPYQLECVARIHAEWESVPSTLLQLPTGCGKTAVFTMVVQQAPTRSIVMAHLDDLVQEAARKVRKWTGLTVAIEMGDSYSREGSTVFGDDAPRVVVTSVQSMSRASRLKRFDPAHFSRLVIDEAHHALGKAYRKIIGHFRSNAALRLLGVTATPKRTDRLSLGQAFDTVAYSMSIEEAINAGWLVPAEQHVVQVAGLDYSALRTVADDFNIADLEKLLCDEGPLRGMARATCDLCGDEPTIVFCVSVKHAWMASEILNSYKPGAATFLAGEEAYKDLDLPPVGKEERRRLLDDFRAGRMQYLCLCQLGLEGFDAPCVRNVAMWRATKSLTLYTQAFGRGTRPAEEIADLLGDLPTAAERVACITASSKPHMRMIDFKGDAGKHHICDLTDLLGGKYGFPVRKYARDLLTTEGKGMRPELLLERAAAELALLDYVHAERRQREALAKAVAVQYSVEQVNPFGGAAPPRLRETKPASLDPPSKKQVYKLVSLGVSEQSARGYSKKQASVVIGKLLAKQQKGA